MKLASFIQTYNLSNKIFDISDRNINRDNYAYFYFMLKDTFKKQGIDLSTCDINEPSYSDIVLYHGLTQDFIDYGYNKSYLLAIESSHVDPKSFDENYHYYFKKIFTWNDDLIDNKKYFKVNYAFAIPKTIPKKFKNKKLCCTIAGNKSASHSDELYTKRVEFIRWFETYHPKEFDLYGTGWNKYHFSGPKIVRAFNKIPYIPELIAKFTNNKYSSYKGLVDSKFETMKNYKFAICYENIKDQNGYITEKIFDCFFAGCVPIYWGAKNVTEYIPRECFIDKREFDSFERIYDYIKNMDEKTYINYLNAIEKFLNSSKADPFRAENFASTIVNEVLKDLDDFS
ncbi:glycosyltransferase family 10 domain-containing protein [Arcobacter sp. CECT 8985]|uniref:glycosyltransferase family 10 domain-containing protein n=1 Tax=Arcobacter sp. CECT 8985 TaxID=1935424 RepID=UPI00100A7126|nr:glycosyltransferase family 10 [Arcobacter sp. CECT 8985]RXJ84872.1 hypothetical protein CRU93_11900 [Arcobacter sp. CECT 8985]